ncbi:MAG: hypothetical protein AAF709_23010, partial [Pseudomonadota bacterium]
MRNARQSLSGRLGHRKLGLRKLAYCFAAATAVAALSTVGAWAQDPAAVAPQTASQSGTFSTQTLGSAGQRLDPAQPLYLQGDELIYDSRGDRVTARGNVEIYVESDHRVVRLGLG